MGNAQNGAKGCGNDRACKPCRPAQASELRFEATATAGEDEVLLTAGGSPAVPAIAQLWTSLAEEKQEELDPAATEVHLGWLNYTTTLMWPYIRKAMMKKVRQVLREKVDEQIAKHPDVKIHEFHFDFDPGFTPPKLEGIRVYERVQEEQHSMQVDFDISWASDASFHVLFTVVGHARGFPVRAEDVGLSELAIHGTMSCLLSPLLPYEPCVATGQAFFLDSPAIHLTMSGIKRLGPIGRIITGIMESAINQVLADGFILPHRLVQNVEKNISLETMISMKSPLPEGVLRIEVLEGKNLPGADVNMLTGKRTSDVFVEVKIGFEKVRTSTISNTLDPVWSDPPGHLFVYNVDQIVRIVVEDDDVMGSDDVMGTVLGFNVYLLCKECVGKPEGGWLDVTDPQGNAAGQIRIRAAYFEIGELGKHPMPSQQASPSLPPYLLTVKLLGLDGPENEDLTKAFANVELIVGDDPSSHDKEKHHANRLMDGLEAAGHYAKTKAQAMKGIGFGHREDGAPIKRRSGKAIRWGSEKCKIEDDLSSQVITPMTIRVMESLCNEEGWSIKDIAAMFGVLEETVTTCVSMRGNFEVVWAEALHFLQPASNPMVGKVKVSVQVPVTNRVRGADDQGLLGCFEVDLPPDTTWGKPWSCRVRKDLSLPKAKSSKKKAEPEAKKRGWRRQG